MKKYILVLLFLAATSTSIYAQSYEDMVQKGMEYAEKDDHFAAAESFKAAMRKEPANPGNIMVSINLAAMLRHLEQYDEALLLYNSALANHPTNSFFLHNRASLYCELQQFNDAMKDYNAILLENSEDQEALYRRALLYMEQKNTLAAEEDFNKVIALNPKNISAQLGLALVLKFREEWDEAEKTYTDLIYKYKTSSELYFQRAECYLNMKKFGRAQADITKSIEFGYKDYPIYILQGRLYLAQYDKRMAKESFIKAKELGASDDLVNGYMYLESTKSKEK